MRTNFKVAPIESIDNDRKTAFGCQLCIKCSKSPNPPTPRRTCEFPTEIHKISCGAVQDGECSRC